MQFRSFANLVADIAKELHQVPGDIDLIVGIPRSGMLAAAAMALNLNVKFCDLNSFISNLEINSGSTRNSNHQHIRFAQDARFVLIVDDSIASGAAIAKAKEKLRELKYSGSIKYLAVYGQPNSLDHVDICLARVQQPRIFQWNLFHRAETVNYCVDIDGVLCLDPTEAENDDGPRYKNFLVQARQIARPSGKIGHLVTSRLEKYRTETEGWLRANSIEYGQLHMLDLPSAEERRRSGVHGKFKSSIYRSLPDTFLFVESETDQAIEIARMSGKPVLDYGTQQLINPGISIRSAIASNSRFIFRAKRKILRLIRS